MPAFTLSDLAKIIESRTSASSEKSYTKSLLECRHAALREEVRRRIRRSRDRGHEGNRENLRNEAADVLYPSLVVLQQAAFRCRM